MKRAIHSIMILTFIGLILSCENATDDKQLILTGQVIGNTDCKHLLKSSSGTINTSDSLSCIEYLFDKENNKLAIKHINAGFNCCPDSLYCTISLINDTIIIQEFEAAALCGCTCLFDLDIDLHGVASRSYHIKFIEPYNREQTMLNFDINLTKDPVGSFCVIRKHTPWGMGRF